MVSRIERVASGKRDDILERQASYLYSTAVTIRGSQRKPREGSDRLEDDSEAFGKLPVPEGTFGKSFRRLTKLWQNHRVSPSRVESRRLELIPRTRENARTSSRMTLRASGKFLVPEGTFGKDFRRLLKLRRSYKVILSRVEEALNIVFRLWQPSSNSAKPLRPGLW